MSSPRDRSSSLSPLARDTRDALDSAISSDVGFSYEYAYSLLAEEENLDKQTAGDIIDQLLSRGHLYEVDGELRLTDH
ncbi:hypothetical protein [Haladaptatus cibarius]|uniref:hypothetical protein n=1 Tax=Haladaptatus cibarius TaxID=453847 RepID=UPI000679B099|nr:hypothetical protein [Haladaptatus cibarius]